jgi:hypothetical protein
MHKSLALVVVATLAFGFTPGTASAQFRGVFMGPSPLYVYPSGNGGYGVGLNFGITAPSPYGRITLPYIQPYELGSSNPPLTSPAPSYSSGSGYLTGGSYSSYDTLGMQIDIAAAQRAAENIRKNHNDARDLIDAQWAYEKLGVSAKAALNNAQEQTDELQKALGAKDEAEIASGVALNRILVAIVIAEGKGAKGVSAFLPPRLLDDIRFKGDKGEAAADLLNLVRQSGKLPFPNNFPGPSLAELEASLQADFTAAITPLLSGKPVDQAKVKKLEASLKKLEAAAPPVIRSLSFDDAIAARRFLNHFESALSALKSSNLTGLINPKWATEGISVADLVKHMTRFKLLFDRATPGGEGSYITLHKALVTYLFVLTQAKK